MYVQISIQRPKAHPRIVSKRNIAITGMIVFLVLGEFGEYYVNIFHWFPLITICQLLPSV